MPPSPTTGRRAGRFAVIGLVLGALALGSAIAHFFLGPIVPDKSIEELVGSKAGQLRDAIVAKIKGEPPTTEPSPEPRFSPDKLVVAGTAIAGFAALMLAVVGFVRREDTRMVGSAAALGGGAILFQFSVVAMAAFVLVMIIAGVILAFAHG